jgi:branched-chain amino acid aminotransferase
MNLVMVSGSLVPQGEARLPVSDLALLRGYGVFDFFRVVQGQPLFVRDYLRRFARSAALLGLPLPDLAEVEAQVRAVIAANELRDAGLHLLLTGGDSPDGVSPGTPCLVMQPRPVKPNPPNLYAAGARLISYPHARELPEAKSINYLTAVRLQGEQRAAAAIDILYHQGGLISETARSNVFVVRGGTLKTPGQGVLAGVTRMRVLELARGICPVQEADVTLDELFAADEVFITSSLKGVMPIVAVDGREVGGGRPGPLTKALMAAFAECVEAYLAAQRPVRA